MKIRILDNAKIDLLEGFYFYESNGENVGSYFLDCLYSDIDSLTLYAGIHRIKGGFIGCYRRDFRLQSITQLRNHMFQFMQSSIVDKIQRLLKAESNQSEQNDGVNEI